jgi:uncharacterized protein YqfB (UPF0267 family)
MPFAPSVLSEEAGNYFYCDQSYPYMTAALRVRESMAKLIPAVVHSDGSSRIQTVDEASNPLYYDLLDNFFKITGIPLLLNTSFNGPGEPIVETVQDALSCFKNIDIKFLAIGDILIIKRYEEYPIRIDQDSVLEVLINNEIDLSEILHKCFPFKSLFPRGRFQLFEEYVGWLRSGRKVTTIRHKRGGIDFPVQIFFKLFSTETFKPDSPERYIGNISVGKIVFKKFSALTLNDAKNDGFNSLRELRTVLTEIYGSIRGDEIVTIYSIAFC